MLIESKETTLAYRCPECGATVFSLVGIFSLSGDMMKLRCRCGKSETVITYTPDRKLRLCIPCIACPKPHHFVLGQNHFFTKEEGVFRLPCPYTGIDICFIGQQQDVLDAVEKSNEELLALLKQSGMKDLSQMRKAPEEDELKSENPILDDVCAYMIRELEDEEAIHCRCPEGEKGDYSYRIHHGRVTISCTKCKAMALLPMTGVDAAQQFLEITHLNLE